MGIARWRVWLVHREHANYLVAVEKTGSVRSQGGGASVDVASPGREQHGAGLLRAGRPSGVVRLGVHTLRREKQACIVRTKYGAFVDM